MINFLIGVIVMYIVFAVIIWRTPDEPGIDSLTSKLNIIKNGIEDERMKRMKIRSQTLEEIRSLRRILAGPEREEENEYHKAMSKSALGTAKKLKALVEHLDLIYFPEGETKTHHKAHFKLSPHMMKKGDKK